MSIKQMEVSYSKNEDRVFLVLKTTKQESLNFALTRRICQSILSNINDIFPSNKLIEAEFSSLEKSSNQDGFSEEEDLKIIYPLGEQAVLVTKYQVLSHSDDMVKVSMSCLGDKIVKLNIDISAFNNVLVLLGRVLHDADWGLDYLINKYGFSYSKSENVRFFN